MQANFYLVIKSLRLILMTFGIYLCLVLVIIYNVFSSEQQANQVHLLQTNLITF